MSASTFRELMSRNTDEVERPRLLADGHYIGKIKTTSLDTSKKKQTPFMRVHLQVLEETNDVAVGANSGMDLMEQEIYRDYYITPKSMFILSDMLDAVLGKTTGRSFDERTPELRDQRVLFQIGHRDSEDGQRQFYEIGTIVAAP
jgi:hypothetical protein